jgi:hypothetical protein
VHSQPSTPPQSINRTPAICRGSFVPQPNLPARIFLLRLLTADHAADDWATEAVQESIDGCSGCMHGPACLLRGLLDLLRVVLCSAPRNTPELRVSGSEIGPAQPANMESAGVLALCIAAGCGCCCDGRPRNADAAVCRATNGTAATPAVRCVRHGDVHELCTASAARRHRCPRVRCIVCKCKLRARPRADAEALRGRPAQRCTGGRRGDGLPCGSPHAASLGGWGVPAVPRVHG